MSAERSCATRCSHQYFHAALFAISLVLAFCANSQDLSYAKEVIHTLTAPDFHGRGYVAEGDKKTAEFIASEFERLGLQPIDGSYFQAFSVAVNAFPGEVSLAFNGLVQTPGVDYLIAPQSPRIKGAFETVHISTDDLKTDKWIKKIDQASGKFLVVNQDQYKGETQEIKERIEQLVGYFQSDQGGPHVGLLLVSSNKLTWSPSPRVGGKPVVQAKTKLDVEDIGLITITIESKFYNQYQTQNVIGRIEGESDSLLVFTGHYDHLGRMGKDVYFPGANDNASGIAMLLDLASYYSERKKKPKYSMAFIAFGAEEIGLLGSQHFVRTPLFPLQDIRFLLNLDLVGTGDDGITVVNGSIHKKQFSQLQAINNRLDLLPAVNTRGEACNSDHCPFHYQGVPSFFIYTLGGIEAYHDVNDKGESLPLTEYNDLFRLITTWIDIF